MPKYIQWSDGSFFWYQRIDFNTEAFCQWAYANNLDVYEELKYDYCCTQNYYSQYITGKDHKICKECRSLKYTPKSKRPTCGEKHFRTQLLTQTNIQGDQ